MSDPIFFFIDEREIEARAGESILAAAERAGVYIPRLCAREGMDAHGSCRICTVRVNGRPVAACTTPASPGAVVENETEELDELRRSLIEMLFVEGTHVCPCCEKSGECELQALSYRFGIAAPRYPMLFPKRALDATHPELMVDHNRCVLCSRCIRASRDLDGKHVFDFVNRGATRRVAINDRLQLSRTGLASSDAAASSCPVGALLKKRQGFRIPVGQRSYDEEPIGTAIERNESGERLR